MSSKEGIRNRRDILYPLLLCLLFFIISFLRSPYSPLYHYTCNTDEVCYQLLSKGLLRGYMPYRDLFDHKGPLTYFVYALGLLIFGGNRVGAFFICTVLNILTFVFLYKSARLMFSDRVSFLGSVIFIFMGSFMPDGFICTTTKPENFLLAPLMVSFYLFVKEARIREGERFKGFSIKHMFITGLMCGCVFMIKFNVCFFYLSFIGLYFIWTLVRKEFKLFLKSCGAFLGGIALICLPIFVFYGVKGALRELFDVYFAFNLFYAGGAVNPIYLFKRSLTASPKLSSTVFILMGIIYLMSFIGQKKMRLQTAINFGVSFLVFIVLTLPLVYSHFFVVFMPLCILPCCFVAEIIGGRLKRLDAVSYVLTGLILCFVLLNAVFRAPATVRIREDQEGIIGYAKTHPDSSAIYAGIEYRPFFIDYLDGIPDMRMFYLPPTYKEDMLIEMAQGIAEHKTDVVFLMDSDSPDDQAMEALILRCGYERYTSYETDGVTIGMYVLPDES